MQKKLILRLKALLAKAVDTLSAEESAELKTLKNIADAAGLDSATGEKKKPAPPKDDDDDDDDDDDNDDDDKDDEDKAAFIARVKSVVDAAVAKVPAGEKLDTKAITDAVIAALPKDTKPDTKAIADAVTASLPKGVTAAEMTKAIADGIAEATKGWRKESKMEFSAESQNAMFPITHRVGNLSVAQKQLLNVILSNGNAVDENAGIPVALLTKAQGRGQLAIQRVKRYGVKQLEVATSGEGAELTFVDLSSELQLRLYAESILAQQMIAREITMPTEVFKLPIRTTLPVFGQGSENVQPASTAPGTANTQLSAEKLISLVPFSYEIDEDSVVPVLSLITQALGIAAGLAFEDALLNGDTTATHMDYDSSLVASTATSVKMFKGLRRLAYDGSLMTDISAGGPNVANIIALKKALGVYGLVPNDVLIVAGVSTYNDLLLLPETINDLGLNRGDSRIRTGMAPNLFGMDVIPSSKCRENLAATGFNTTGGPNTFAGLVVFRKSSFIVGVRSEFKIELWRDPRSQSNYVIAAFRRAFAGIEAPSSTVPSVAVGYNYTA